MAASGELELVVSATLHSGCSHAVLRVLRAMGPQNTQIKACKLTPNGCQLCRTSNFFMVSFFSIVHARGAGLPLESLPNDGSTV